MLNGDGYVKLLSDLIGSLCCFVCSDRLSQHEGLLTEGHVRVIVCDSQIFLKYQESKKYLSDKVD